MVTERRNIASRILLKRINKGPLGAGLASMDIGSADRLALQNLQIPEHSTNITLPKYVSLSGGAGKTGSTQRQPQPLQLLPNSVTIASLFQDRDTSTLWRSNTVKTPGPRISLRQHHRNPCCTLSRNSAQVPLHTILLGVGGGIYTPHTLEPLKELDLDAHTATQLARSFMLILSSTLINLLVPDTLLRRFFSILTTEISTGYR
eukprot:1149421-Pelagomonas_calceolata.AAC.10